MTEQKLSLEDILLLWYVNNKAVGFDIPQYWHYVYQVDDVPQRIQHFVDTKLLTTCVVRKKEKWIATSKANAVLNEYSHIFYYHSYRNILEPSLTLKKVDELYKAKGKTSVEDFFIDYHTELVSVYWQNKKYGSARNAILTIAEILFRLPKYTEALSNFLLASYLDMTGLDNLTADRNEYTQKDVEQVQLAPGVIAYIADCLRNNNMTVSNLPAAFEKATQDVTIVDSTYTKQEALNKVMNAVKEIENS